MNYFYGWNIVGCAFVIAVVGWGLGFYGPGIYIAKLNDAHGWPIAALSAAVTLYYVGSAGFVMFIGDVIARFGARLTVLAGGTCLAAGAVILTCTDALWQVFGILVLMSPGCAATTGAAIQTIVAPWFVKKRGLAISLALNGSSCGGILVAPLLLASIDRFGFSVGTFLVSALLLLVLWPIVTLILIDRPHDLGLLPDGLSCAYGTAGPPAPARDTMRRRLDLLREAHFYTLSLPFALGLTAQVGFLVHQVPYLLPELGTALTGWCVSLTLASAVFGRLVVGTFIDAVNVRVAAALNFAVQIAAISILLMTEGTVATLAACALFGLGVGNMITFPALIIQREYPSPEFSRILGLLTAINQFTFAFGPGLLGLGRQWSGDYQMPLLICMCLQVLAAVIVMAGIRRRGRITAN